MQVTMSAPGTCFQAGPGLQDRDVWHPCWDLAHRQAQQPGPRQMSLYSHVANKAADCRLAGASIAKPPIRSSQLAVHPVQHYLQCSDMLAYRRCSYRIPWSADACTATCSAMCMPARAWYWRTGLAHLVPLLLGHQALLHNICGGDGHIVVLSLGGWSDDVLRQPARTSLPQC